MSSEPVAAFRFRRARAADAAVIVALVESAYRGESSRAGWTTEAEFLDGQRTDIEEVSEILAREGTAMLLAEAPTRGQGRSGAPLACCLIERQGDQSCYFGMFSVRPDLQRGGIGRALLAQAEHFAREAWRCREMRMGVIDLRAELIAWYERRGYRRTGEYKAFPYGNARAGIPRRDDLRFEWLVKPLTPEPPA